MFVADEAERLIPGLRRYARALTGSQKAGDTAVAHVLGDLTQLNNRLREPKHVRVWLYQRIGEYCVDIANDGLISRLSDIPRRAVLLVAMEELSPAEAGECLNLTEAECEAALRTAESALKQMIAGKVFIIEDEIFIQIELQRLVEGLGHEVVGTATTKNEAILKAPGLEPDIILADIRLADESSGVEAAQFITDALNVPVVFITAYPERLLTGERPEPAYLIPKPFNPDQVIAVVSQALLAAQLEKEKKGRPVKTARSA